MIHLARVASREEGQIKAHQILTELVGKDSLLAVSGGTSVDYKEMIVGPGDIHPGAVCMVDERYGMPYHENSNELLVKKSGLIEYLASLKIPFTKVLEGKSLEQTEKDYDLKIRMLFAKYQGKVGVMGVAANLHTGGIFPNSKALKSPAYAVSDVVDDVYRERITLTLKALGEFDNFLILMFGEEKKEALSKILDKNENDMQKYPAIFYRKCRANAHLVTDISL